MGLFVGERRGCGCFRIDSRAWVVGLTALLLSHLWYQSMYT